LVRRPVKGALSRPFRVAALPATTLLPKTPFFAARHELFNAEHIVEAARRLGAIERQRKVDMPGLVQAAVLSLSPIPGTQTTIYTLYCGIAGHTLAPSAFYERFTKPFAALMGELARRAIQAVMAVEPHDAEGQALQHLLERFTDVCVTDSTCQILHRLAACWAPSTSKERPASFKLHSVVSLRDNLPVEFHFSSQRDHDNGQLDDSALTPGTLFMADLGYVDQSRVLRLILRQIHTLMRLKLSQNPVIRRVVRGGGDKKAARGKKLDEAIDQGVLVFTSGAIDLDVDLEGVVDGEKVKRTVRVVGLSEPEIDDGNPRWYLTTVPRDVFNPEQVGLAYRLRWDIELLWKQMKSGAGMAALRAWREESVQALVYGKIVAVALARLLELSVCEVTREHAVGQLAIVLALSRSVPMMMAMALQERGVTIEEMERRILMIAAHVARSRNRRRDRAKRAQREGL